MSGGSRGVGLEIAKALGKDGANVAILAKTTEPHPTLPGTIFTAADEIKQVGGNPLPIVCDIRFEDQVEAAVEETVSKFGGIDICINNASAIHLTDTVNTPMKRYDLMHNINVRGTFMLSQKCIPHLIKGDNPHILTLSPPLDIDRKWFGITLAYTTAKYGMSLVAHGLAEELGKHNVASNCLWPRTSLDTAAVRNVIGAELVKGSRKPSIYADAAYAVLKRDSSTCTGNFFLDQDVLEEEGVSDFDQYSIDPEATLVSDFFVEIDPSCVDDVIAGCVSQLGEQTGNVGRNAALAAGLPETVPGTTVDRQCGSSQQALHFAAQGIIAGSYEVAIACGVEMMSRVPMGSTFSYEGPEGASTAFGPKMYDRYPGLVPQGISAEMMAEKWNLDRNELDEISYSSHQRALNAWENGYFKKQILEVPEALHKDEGVREETTKEILSQLKPAFKPDGVITAGNSSQISDGAAALLLVSEDILNKFNLEPIAKIRSMAVVGTDPVLMLSGPIPATRKALDQAKLKPEDINLAEINEAFSSVVGAWRKEFPEINYENVNANGGSIAIGHPLGATGARLMTNLIHEMKRNKLKYGLQAICEGGGTANATIVELV